MNHIGAKLEASLIAIHVKKLYINKNLRSGTTVKCSSVADPNNFDGDPDSTSEKNRILLYVKNF
jgi:hypothetical protein